MGYQNKSQKEYIEEALCNDFLNLYNKRKNKCKELIFVRAGNSCKFEPDCICTDNTAIEITDAYDSSYSAEKIHGYRRGASVQQKPEYLLRSFENTENIICAKLDKLNNGNYRGWSGNILLVCKIYCPLVTDAEVKLFIKNYVSFSQDGFFEKYFSEIWICWQSEKHGVLQVRQLK